ncbi:TPA: fimbrial protein [Providencia alcalifaciens]|nr:MULTISPECIES: fimbrial protein [Providencia]ETT04377.1 fimbrial protein [Providencia alcalifaciens F90-2004]EUC97312.1 fimbrial protein [Providencia alcalifaciens PAL-2]EUD06882.1 fimbrial protein [Providencia alcalifaciens R90-1475]EUD03464.1 fimbrial protein [Providencia alcalifaciens RIMD 1656011]EUD11159.1 fimbrial protein [Providencia alcalifaciens 205/92]
MMKISHFLGAICLLVSHFSYADILITLETTLVRPSCVITNENGDKELYVNFQNVALDRLTEEKQSFGILIKQCDLRKNLRVYLSPKEGSTLTINNETVLSTTIQGLGIRFSQANRNTAINLLKWEPIFPSISGDTATLTLQSQLVTNQLPETLEVGPFSAALSVMIDYL